MDITVLVLLTFNITISVAGLAYMVWGIREVIQITREIIEITRAGDAAIFLQGRRMEEVFREMREELRRG